MGASSAAPQPRCPPDAAVHAGDLLHPYPWPKEEPPFGSACPVGPFLPGGAVAAPELPPGAAGTVPPPAALAPMEHGVPNLLISPHLLPREHPWVGVGVGWVGIGHGCGVAMGWLWGGRGVDSEGAVGWLAMGTGVVGHGCGVAVGWLNVAMGLTVMEE